MGNQICCQQPVSQQIHQQLYHLSSPIEEINYNGNPISDQHSQQNNFNNKKLDLPVISKEVQTVMNEHNPFEYEFNHQGDNTIVRFGKDIYYGLLDQTQRPTGFGKMYKENGALFIGQFQSGKAQGPSFYIMKDGSYYQGQMHDNKANCTNGKFLTKNLEYVGGFSNNEFNGKGTQKAFDHVYVFEGTYHNGKKKEGVMKWGKVNFDYIYEGMFDENGQFTGKGKFTDPEGLYEGQFLKGQKHGYGCYKYNTKLRYEGFYSHNKKEGQGQILNDDGSIAYKGLFKNGMPNGKGLATSKSGIAFEAEWIDGIDARML